MKTAALITLFIFPLASFAGTHTATIVKLENSSVIYVPGENKQAGFAHVKYLDAVYHIVPAAKGSKLENGFILTTGPKSKAKVVFKNGDHLFVSENTQYKIDWKRDAGPKEDPSVISLIRGAVRGLIQKDGPRTGMKVKTASTVLGIRGTDFFVTENHGTLNVSVIRGNVEVFDNETGNKSANVQSGQTLVKEDKEINISAITKEDLREISKSVVVEMKAEESKPEVAKELAELETSATEVTLNDIKQYQPQLYKEISEKQNVKEMTSDSLAVNTVKIMEEKAPLRAKKPSQSELDDDSDPYENYKFKKK